MDRRTFLLSAGLGLAGGTAVASEKVKVLYFASYACPACRAFEAAVRKEPYKSKLDKIDFTVVNGPANPALRRKYGVTAYPTVVVLNPDGSTVLLVGAAAILEMLVKL